MNIVDDERKSSYKTIRDDESLKRSLLILRRIIGYSGFALAPICALTSLRRDHGVLGSISAYFFSAAHDAFVAILFMLAVALWSYVGYEKIERYVAGFAGTCAAFVALSPTLAPTWATSVLPAVNDIGERQLDGYVKMLFERTFYGAGPHIHNAAAGLLFVCFLIFSGSFFMRTDASPPYPNDLGKALGQMVRELWQGLMGKTPISQGTTPEKLMNNKVYRLCSWGIIVGIVWAIASNVLGGEKVFGWGGVFLAEVIALVSFGFSWIRKSESEFGAVRRLVKRVTGIGPG